MQLRELVGTCINPDPERRPTIEYVYSIAQQMYSWSQQAQPVQQLQQQQHPLPTVVQQTKTFQAIAAPGTQ